MDLEKDTITVKKKYYYTIFEFIHLLIVEYPPSWQTHIQETLFLPFDYSESSGRDKYANNYKTV